MTTGIITTLSVSALWMMILGLAMLFLSYGHILMLTVVGLFVFLLGFVLIVWRIKHGVFVEEFKRYVARNSK